MEWMLLPFKRFADFSGRSCRKEYWMFALLYVIVVFALGMIGGALDLAWLPAIGYLIFIIPLIAVGVRRMHDTDHSGWWLLVPIVPIVFAVTAGTAGPNRFGPDPLTNDPTSTFA
jgi:uncharacterized membrane protein YhaH (DUF805 family)